MDIYRLTLSIDKSESRALQKAVYELSKDDVIATQSIIVRALIHLMPEHKKLLAKVKELQKLDGRRTHLSRRWRGRIAPKA